MTRDFYASAGPDFEPIFHYIENGFHPVNIGDIINDRYRVVNKLGFGYNSTVWLVEDVSQGRFASLKILAADSSSESSELLVSRHLQSQQERDFPHPGREHVVQIYDTFILQGPNGTHHCIVTEVLEISLASKVEEFYGPGRRHFPEEVTKRVAGQVALAVAYLHACGIIHGDLHIANVLFYSPKLNTASAEELNTIYGPPRLETILCADKTVAPATPHIPQHLIYSSERLPLFEICLSSVDEIHVKICDFGESSLINPNTFISNPFEANMPRIYAAPEIIFNDISAPTTSMEVWALGVLIHMIINLKVPMFISEYDIDDLIIESMVLALGKPPDKWWKKWTARADYFDDNGVHYLDKTHQIQKGINGICAGMKFSEEEYDGFKQLLSKIFRYVPEERISAEDVVRLLPQGWVSPSALEQLDRMREGREGVWF